MTPLSNLRALYEEAALGPCAVHPAISRVDEFTDGGPDPVLLLAFPHDRRSEAQTFAIGKLFCHMHRHLPALLALAEAANDNIKARWPLGFKGGTQNLSGETVDRVDRALIEALSPLLTRKTTP